MSEREFCIPTEEEVAELSRRLPTDGVDGYLNRLRQKQDEWKTIPLNIGVIGFSGVGKSSFINTIRRLTADDEGAASVGSTETTIEIQAYTHPNNPLLKFWDLPGVGTPKFPQDKYLDCIGFDRFDFFLLLSATRFTAIDAWLGREIAAKDKKYFYVRTKIHNDMESNKRAHPRTHDESKELDKIRRGTRELLESDSTPLFLIDNYEPQKYEFCELEEHLIKGFPELKRQALIYSVSAFSDKVIEMKVKELRSFMWKVSLFSAAVAAVPLPGLSVAVDLGLVLTHIIFYRQQLGLDGDSLKRLAKYASTDFEKLREVVESRIAISFTLEGVKTFALAIPGLAASTALEEASRFVPVIGSLIAAPLSFGTTYFVLNYILNKMEETALEVIRIAFDPSSN